MSCMSSTPLSRMASSSMKDNVGEEGVVYVAVVIHMNQLLEDINTTEAYGVPAAEIFYEESRIPLEVEGVKLVVDITGPTLLSMLAYNPSILENLKKGVQLGKVEILGVTYGQIPLQYLPYSHVEKHVVFENQLLEKIFGVKPTGIWLEDRQWSPQLPYIISKLRFKYTIVDDNTYLDANPDKDPYSVYYPHIAEYNNSAIIVFHISKYMRYHLRNPDTVDQLIDYLRDIREKTRNYPIPPIVVYGDDAEFGLNRKVLEELVKTPWIKYTTLTEYIEKYHEYFTPANYNITSTYPEYIEIHGREWYKWYSSGVGSRLREIFEKAGMEIRELVEKNNDLEWLVNASWTTLLLAEWQYGNFYKTSRESNLDYITDTYIYTGLGKLYLEKTINYTEKTIKLLTGEKKITLYMCGNWGIGIDLEYGVIRTLINFREKTILTPLKYFNTEKWWKYTPPAGIVLEERITTTYMDNNSLILETQNNKYILRVDNDKLVLVTPGKTLVELMLTPGGYFKHVFSAYFPRYYTSTMSNNTIAVMDEKGRGIRITGIVVKEIFDQRFNTYIYGTVENRLVIEMYNPGKTSGSLLRPFEKTTTTASKRNNTGLILLVVSLILLLLVIAYIMYHYRLNA